MRMTSSSAPSPTVQIGGVDIDCLTEQQVIDHVFDRLAEGRGGLLLTANVDHLRQIRDGGALATVYPRGDLVVADGMPLVWASRLQGTPLPERVAGSDLLWTISQRAAERSATVYLLGGAKGAASRTAEMLVERYPGLRVVGTACPPRGFEEDPETFDAVLREIVACRPDVIFTALGAPKQEQVNLALAARLPGAWLMGVGAAFDMASGVVRRAPRALQGGGLEWLYRLIQEPRRLSRRYLVDGVPVAADLFRDSLRRRFC